MNELIQSIENSISDAESDKSKLTKEILDLEGMSGNKVRHFLNNICGSIKDSRYLEIGSWKGSTLISAYYKNNLRKCVAIDNWSEFNDPKSKLSTKETFLSNVKEFNIEENFTFYETDAFKIDLNKIDSKFNIYFYDGGHAETSQYMAYKYYDSILDGVFITMVDDWRHSGVQDGTRRAFKELKYNVIKDWEYISTDDRMGWWNGFYIALVEK